MSQIEISNLVSIPSNESENFAPVHEKPLIQLDPPRGWQLINVRELWKARELLFFLAWRDVKVRYKQTALGASWAVLQPAMMMVVFTIFFRKMAGVAGGNVPYPIFVYAGLLPWTFFATSITNAGNSVVSSERLITKIYFPRLTIPIASVGAAAVDFCVALCMLVILMFCYGIHPGWSVLIAPLLMAIIALTATGIGTLIAAMTVSYRDFKYVLPFLTQVWMFATPSIYTNATQQSLGRWHVLLDLNPMTGLISAFRSSCVGDAIPWRQVGISSICAIIVFVGGCFYFRKMEAGFSDNI
jgi:lipopolysaccharide transport system permease protein